MALKYRVVSRKVPAGPEKGELKCYGHVCSGEIIGFDELCEEITEHSTGTKGDVAVALRGMEYCIAQELAGGNSVEFGDLGHFRMSGSSIGADSVEEFHLNLMKRPRVVFAPGKELRNLCAKARFTRETVKTVTEPEECARPHVG